MLFVHVCYWDDKNIVFDFSSDFESVVFCIVSLNMLLTKRIT
jgi:hypothetical protein